MRRLAISGDGEYACKIITFTCAYTCVHAMVLPMKKHVPIIMLLFSISVPCERKAEGVISIALMASCLRRLVFLMVFGLVQQSRADIKELKSAHSGPLNELSVNSRYTATGDQFLLSKLQHQVCFRNYY